MKYFSWLTRIWWKHKIVSGILPSLSHSQYTNFRAKADTSPWTTSGKAEPALCYIFHRIQRKSENILQYHPNGPQSGTFKSQKLVSAQQGVCLLSSVMTLLLRRTRLWRTGLGSVILVLFQCSSVASPLVRQQSRREQAPYLLLELCQRAITWKLISVWQPSQLAIGNKANWFATESVTLPTNHMKISRANKTHFIANFWIAALSLVTKAWRARMGIVLAHFSTENSKLWPCFYRFPDIHCICKEENARNKHLGFTGPQSNFKLYESQHNFHLL